MRDNSRVVGFPDFRSHCCDEWNIAACCFMQLNVHPGTKIIIPTIDNWSAIRTFAP